MVRAAERSSGFTLLEVLIALLVLMVGMLAGLMLMLMSIRGSREAVLHTQTVLMARSMVDRMSANPVGVWLGAYDGPHDGTPGASTDDCATPAAACSPTELAARDRFEWRMEIEQSLSEGTQASIACTPASATPIGSELSKAPPYDGYCELDITWDEQTIEGAVEQQHVTWRFVP